MDPGNCQLATFRYDLERLTSLTFNTKYFVVNAVKIYSARVIFNSRTFYARVMTSELVTSIKCP